MTSPEHIHPIAFSPRYRVHRRLFRKPLLVLQVPDGEVEVVNNDSIVEVETIPQWRDATVADLAGQMGGAS